WPTSAKATVGNLRLHSRAKVGAEGGTRTPTVLLPPAPQAGASANSATSAKRGAGLKPANVVCRLAGPEGPALLLLRRRCRSRVRRRRTCRGRLRLSTLCGRCRCRLTRRLRCRG